MEPQHRNSWKPEQLRGADYSYRNLVPIGVGGAMGDSFEAEVADGENAGMKVFVKLPHIPEDAADFIALRDRIARVFTGLFSEVANYQQLHGLQCVAQVFDAGVFKFSMGIPYPVLLPFIVQELVQGENLRAALRPKQQDDQRVPSADTAGPKFELDHSTYLLAARTILRSVRQVHERYVVHGDLHPGNLMAERGASGQVNWSTLRIVDFGQAFLAQMALSAPETSPGNNKHTYKAPERRNRSEHWSFNADIYSIGVILYFLATGSEPDEPLPDVGTARFVREMVQSHNPTLLTAAPALPEIIAKAVNASVPQRYQRVAEIERDLEDLALEYHPKSLPSEGDIASLLASCIPMDCENPFFRDLFVQSLEEFREVVEVFRNSKVRFDLTGDRLTLISRLVRYLTILGPGDEYLTVTTPVFWGPENLGYEGRFLAANEILLRRRVKIKRLFLCTEKQLEEPLWQSVLDSHRDMRERVRHHVPDIDNLLTFAVEVVPEDGFAAVHGPGHVVGLWVKGGTYTSIAFGLDDSGRQLRRATFMELEEAQGAAIRKSMATGSPKRLSPEMQ